MTNDCSPGEGSGQPNEAPSTDASSDGDRLITRVLAGDREALEEFLLRNYGSLEHYVRAKIPRHRRGTVAPEDIIQDIYLRAFRAADKFEGRGKSQLFAWLHTIARSAVFDAFRKERPAGHVIEKEADRLPADNAELTGLLQDLAIDENPMASQAARAHELHDAFLAAMENLSAEYRQVIDLLYLQQLDIETVATRLDRSVDSVRGLRMRARKQLREAIARLSRFI